MNRRRIMAIITLVLFLFGLVAFFYGFATKNEGLGNNSIFILFACAIATYILKRQGKSDDDAGANSSAKDDENASKGDDSDQIDEN